MRFVPFQALSTERLLLRIFRTDDAPAYFACLGGSDVVTKYMLWEPHRDVSESEASIQKIRHRYESSTPYTWAISPKGADTLIGRIDLLRLDEQTGTCSFAYMLGADFWNVGYGTETLKAVLQFAFMQLDASAIEADHMADNPASGAVMLKAGMTFQKTISNKYEKQGIYHNANVFRITKADWLTKNALSDSHPDCF